MAVVPALADDAGYSAGPRARFAVAAGLAAAAAAALDVAAVRRALRSPLVVVLVLLAVLGAASAAWTVGVSGDAIRWGAVTGGFAAVVVAVAVLARDDRSRIAIAAATTALAVAIAVVGLVAAARTSVPLAHREAGLWRPASTFQYAPALALLMVGVLPMLLRGMCASGRATAVACAFGAAVAGAVLGLAESRVEAGFAAAVGLVALAWPRPTLGASRAAAAAAVAVVVSAGLGAYAVVGGYVVVTPPPDGTRRLLELGAVLLAAAVLWALARPVLARGGRAALVAVALLTAAGPVAAATKPPARLIASQISSSRASPEPAPAPRRLHPVRDRLLHGRLHIWRAAWRTFEDRPLQGGGADSFYFASAAHQGPRSVFYAHDLPLELAAELGIGGLLGALALFAAGAATLWRARAGPATWLFGPAAATFLAANLVDWPWHFAGSGAVWAVAMGALLGGSATAPSPR